MENERRKYKRVVLDKEVILSQDDKTWSSKLIDISLKGLLLEEPEGWSGEPGEEYSLKVLLGEGAGPVISQQVDLVHREDGRLGFRWKLIDPDSLDHLRRLLTYNLADPNEVERELEELFKR